MWQVGNFAWKLIIYFSLIPLKNTNNRLQHNKELLTQTKYALLKTWAPLCAHENCNFHAQDSCDGYRYAHYHRLYIQSPIRVSLVVRLASPRELKELCYIRETNKVQVQSRKSEVVDLTEDDVWNWIKTGQDDYLKQVILFSSIIIFNMIPG